MPFEDRKIYYTLSIAINLFIKKKKKINLSS